DRVMKITDQLCGSGEPLPWFEQIEPIRPRHRAGDEGQHLAAAIVDAQRPGCTLKPGRVQIPQQRVHRRGVGTSRAPDRVTDTYHPGTHVPTGQRLLSIVSVVHADSLSCPPRARSSGEPPAITVTHRQDPKAGRAPHPAPTWCDPQRAA